MLLAFGTDINDGGGDSIDVVFTVNGTRGNLNAGDYIIKSKTDSNTLVLNTPVVETEHLLSYRIERKVSSIALVRDVDYTADADKITMLSSLVIVSAVIYASYRALRNDLAGSVVEFADINALIAAHGTEQITPANPYAYSVSKLFDNTVTAVYALALNENAVTNELLSYQVALDVLEKSDMYALVPLTQSPIIHQAMRTHVVGLSNEGKTRIAIINRKLVTEQIIVPSTTISSDVANSRLVVNTQIDGAAVFITPNTLNDSTPDQFMNVKRGDTVIITAGTNAIVGQYTVTLVTNLNKIVLDANIVTADSTDVTYYIVRRDGMSSDGITIYDRNASFISDEVVAGHFFRFPSGAFYKVTSVVSELQLQITKVPGVTTLQTGFTYEIYKALTKAEQASVLAGYSAGLGSRRVVNTWPDAINTTVGNSTELLPGYYGGVIIGALVAGLPTQQGFTNLAVSGVLSLIHSNKYFSDEQLNVIAGGGTLIFAQDTDQGAVYCRHSLTTDMSSIKFQELSVTKNVDYADKYIKKQFAHFIGQYNIYDGTFDELKTNAKAVITNLKNQKYDKVGGVIKNGTLKELKESETKIDTIVGRFGMDFPIPLNNLELTVEV